MNIGIVTAYNDMLSAHQPYGRYPEQIKLFAREVGATAQVAGGVPAMCDGVTQGQAGMDLSLFSRDNIAQGTAIALSHAMFEGALLLGICDKIVPGLLIGALRFGHLPTILIPAGPMPSGLANKEKQRIRQLYAEGKATRDELLEAEAASYHGAGTCTFYGTANSNQMLMEIMGLHIPGSAFTHPGTKLRQELTRAATHRVAAIGWDGDDYRPLARCVDEKAIVNAIIGLLATGGSTNHAIHLPAIARAAGIIIDWQDFDELSHAVPLLARVYPNGAGDVNNFHAAGGIGYVVRELLDAGLLHGDVLTVGGTMADYGNEPTLVDSKEPFPREGGGPSPDIAAIATAGDGPLPSQGNKLGGSPPRNVARRHDAAPGCGAFLARWRDALARGQSGPRDHQDQRGRRGSLDDRGAVPDFRQSGCGAGGVQGRRTRTGCHRRRPLSGPARQRHARTPQADPRARGVAGPRVPRRAADRRPDDRAPAARCRR